MQLGTTSTCLFIFLSFVSSFLRAQVLNIGMAYVVSMDDPSTHNYHVTLHYFSKGQKNVDLKMSVWTPGYYELIDYAKAVHNFKVVDSAGNNVNWNKPTKNNWHIDANSSSNLTITYDVTAVVLFVGNVYLDESRGYITPGGMFMYSDDELQKPLTIQIKPYKGWADIVATGLDSIPKQHHTFYAPNFDVLYDSPFLMGNLEDLPSFKVKNVPHYFIGYGISQFDHQAFMSDLKKIIQSATNIIGDIPYTHYTFLEIGKGGGGIEHLNSTSISMRNSEVFCNPKYKTGFYNFLAHEYFHHYNVKRIRPIELGPFDYSKENVTNMLWVSEGFTDYYATLILKRAGLITGRDVLDSYQNHIKAYENVPGHLFQSATQSSRETWAGNPFVIKANVADRDAVYKTISYYDKGCIIGLMLDFKIRHETKNKRSLDDIMRTLYYTYYKAKQRGFTEKEFWEECEKAAGTTLKELYDYSSTVKQVNYPKYFSYAGLNIDTTIKELSGVYSGISVTQKDTALIVAEVEWHSPGWYTGLRANDTILEIDNVKANSDLFNNLLTNKSNGDVLLMKVLMAGKVQIVKVRLTAQQTKNFSITRMHNLDDLQSAIYKSWLALNIP